MANSPGVFYEVQYCYWDCMWRPFTDGHSSEEQAQESLDRAQLDLPQYESINGDGPVRFRILKVSSEVANG